MKSLWSPPNLPTFLSLDYYIRFTGNSTHIHILLKFMNMFSSLQLLLSYDYIMHLVVYISSTRVVLEFFCVEYLQFAKILIVYSYQEGRRLVF